MLLNSVSLRILPFTLPIILRQPSTDTSIPQNKELTQVPSPHQKSQNVADICPQVHHIFYKD